MRIKWPNDLYSNSLKLGGILCHSVYREAKFHLVVGAGINVTNREPSICVQQILEDAAAEERGSSSGEMIQLEVPAAPLSCVLQMTHNFYNDTVCQNRTSSLPS